MKTEEEIKKRISVLEEEIEILLNEQRESDFPQAVAILQDVINSKKHRIHELNWILE